MIGICAFVGSIAGSYVPTIWGASELGLVSLGFSVIGGIAGVFFGARLAAG